MDNMKMIICKNLIKNFPGTTEDINLANIMFGPYISMLKGKYAHPKPIQVIDDYIEIPEELISINYLLSLDIDVMFINTHPMFTTIYR